MQNKGYSYFSFRKSHRISDLWVTGAMSVIMASVGNYGQPHMSYSGGDPSQRSPNDIKFVLTFICLINKYEHGQLSRNLTMWIQTKYFYCTCFAVTSYLVPKWPLHKEKHHNYSALFSTSAFDENK